MSGRRAGSYQYNPRQRSELNVEGLRCGNNTWHGVGKGVSSFRDTRVER